MSERDELNVPLKEVFKAGFGQNTKATEGRKQAERRAGRTLKERNRGGSGPRRDVQVNTRQTQPTKDLLEKMAAKLTAKRGTKVSEADIVEIAIVYLAERELKD